MATRDFAISQDGEAALRTTDNESFGAGKRNRLSCGMVSSSLRVRSYLQFVHDWTDMTNVSQVQMRLRKSTGDGSWGGTPRAYVKQVMESWAEGTRGSDGLLYANNALEWDTKPSTTGGAEVHSGVISVDGDGYYWIDITDIAQRWAPASVLVDGVVGANEANYGVEMRADTETAQGNQSECRSSDYGSGAPIIRVTYTNNSPPNAPTWVSPTEGELVEDASPVYATVPTPIFVFDHSDPEGNGITSYDIEVTREGWGSPLWSVSNQTSGISGNRVTRAYGGAGLERGVLVWARARTKDSGSGTVGPWSETSFWINDTGLATVYTPLVTDSPAYVVQLNGGADLHMGVVFSWPDGLYWGSPGKQQARVRMYADSAGAPGALIEDSGWQDEDWSGWWSYGSYWGAWLSTTTLTALSYYHLSVEHRDHLGLSRGALTRRVRAIFGVAEYRSADLGSVSAWSAIAQTQADGVSIVNIFYNSSSDGSTLSDPWRSNLGDVTPRSYLHYRVLLMIRDVATTIPSLDRLTLNYVATARTPDGWSGDGVVDEAAYYYGRQALKIAGNGTERVAFQNVLLKADTPYSLSGRIKSFGNSGARIRLCDVAGNVISSGGSNVETQISTGTHDFEDGIATYQSFRTPAGAGDVEYRVECVVDGAEGTTAWFDAIMLEASEVVTPWNPAQIGVATVLDAAGIQIDAHAGGVARFRGASGGPDDTVELGDEGFRVNRSLEFAEQATDPGTPATGRQRLFVRESDHLLCLIDESGVVTPLGSGGGAHDHDTDALTPASVTATGDVTADRFIATGNNKMLYKVGDDCWLGDVNTANRIGVRGVQDAAQGGFIFGSDGDTNIFRQAANYLRSEDKFRSASLNIQVKAGTPVDGDVVGGAENGDLIWDSTNSILYVRSGGSWVPVSSGSSSSFVGCTAVRTATQSLSNGSATAVLFTAADEEDTDAFHNPSSNSDRITIPTGLGGLYDIIGGAQFASNSTGGRAVCITLNSTALTGALTGMGSQFQTNGSVESRGNVAGYRIALSAGDIIRMVVRQDSGGSLNLTGARLTVSKVG